MNSAMPATAMRLLLPPKMKIIQVAERLVDSLDSFWPWEPGIESFEGLVDQPDQFMLLIQPRPGKEDHIRLYQVISYHTGFITPR